MKIKQLHIILIKDLPLYMLTIKFKYIEGSFLDNTLLYLKEPIFNIQVSLNIFFFREYVKFLFYDLNRID